MSGAEQDQFARELLELIICDAPGQPDMWQRRTAALCVHYKCAGIGSVADLAKLFGVSRAAIYDQTYNLEYKILEIKGKFLSQTDKPLPGLEGEYTFD